MESGSNLSVDGAEFNENCAKSGTGGGIHCGTKVFAIVNKTKFTSNQANIGGGGMAVVETREVMISECSFLRNNSTDGGGVYSDADMETVQVVKCTFNGNYAGARSQSVRYQT